VVRRSEEGLIENTQWAQWSVLSGVILMQIIYTDKSAEQKRTEGANSRLPV